MAKRAVCTGIFVAGVLLSAQSLLGGNVWHVNNQAANASDGNPGTEEAPFLTINAATTNELFEAGDTVLVHPGVYDSGVVTDGPSWQSRVYVPKKCIIKAVSDDVGATVIKGRLGTEDRGMGDDSVRCVLFGTDAADSEISGFTICEGGTRRKDSGAGSGGGVSAHTTKAYVVDCVISNCAAMKGGGVYQCTAVRCLFVDNRAYGSTSGNCGAAANKVNLFNCVIDGCSGGRSDATLAAALSECTSVNCTIVNSKTGVSTGKIYNSVICVSSGIDNAKSATVSNCATTGGYGYYQLFAPGVGDYRLVAGGGSDLQCSAGTVKTVFPNLPEKYLAADFAGNEFPESGTCLPGAVQESVQVKGGAIQASAAGLLIDGSPVRKGGYVFAGSWPTQYCISAAVSSGKYLWSFERDIANGGRVFPQLDDTAWIMPSPEVSNVTTTYPRYASRAFYVNPDPGIGSDSNDGLSEDTPLETLQKAMDKSVSGSGDQDYTVIFAAEGDYSKGGRTIHQNQANNWTLTNRVCAVSGGYYVRLIGKGIGRSFISGAPDPDTGGAGPGAVRPIGAYSHNMVVQGFTIRNGYTLSSSTKVENFTAAVVGRATDWTMDGNMLTIADCLITDCTTVPSGDIVKYANLQRCRITGNSGGACIFNSRVRASACLIEGNSTSEGGSVLASCRAANCTVRAEDGTAMTGSGGAIYSSILEGGGKLSAGNRIYGSLVWDLDGGALPSDCDWRFGAPCFADEANGDWRVASFSPALECGLAPGAGNWGTNWWKLAATGDIDGRRLSFNSFRPVAGCVQEVKEMAGAYVAAANGGLNHPSGYLDFGGAETAEIGFGAGTRPVSGIIVNGVTNMFDEVGAVSVSADAGTYIEPIYTKDWYVDAAAGADDDGWGYTPLSAKRTFKGLLDAGLVIAGDTVHAAEGVYSNGVMTVGAETVGARIVVPPGVEVVADGKVENTVIVGAKATVEPDTYGLGTDAVRCVSLGADSVIRGFTLTGGRTGRFGSGNDAKEYKENLGGGVYGLERKSGKAVDCVISNNVAYRGGGGAYTTLVKCRVLENRGRDSEGGGGGLYRGDASGSVFSGNRGMYPVMYFGSLLHCTAAGGNDGGYGVYTTSYCLMKNCVFAQKVRIKTTETARAYHSFFAEEPVLESPDTFAEGCKVVGAENLQMDAEGRPVVGHNAAIDSASMEHYSVEELGDVDVLGGMRIQNGALDAGAVEADWRSFYAARISGGNSGFSVVSASSNVVCLADSPVTLYPGQRLEAAWNRRGDRIVNYETSFRVSGGGTLTVTADGKDYAYTSADGDVTLKFASADGLSLSFAYAGGVDDAGMAEILSSVRSVGLWMVIR